MRLPSYTGIVFLCIRILLWFSLHGLWVVGRGIGARGAVYASWRMTAFGAVITMPMIDGARHLVHSIQSMLYRVLTCHS